jgi:hypothetical protein
MNPTLTTMQPAGKSRNAELARFLDRWSDAELQQGHHALAEKLAHEAAGIRAEAVL